MIAVEIKDWALTLTGRNGIEGLVELSVGTAAVRERGVDVPERLIVIARCGMRDGDVWLEPLYARLPGAAVDETALEIHQLLSSELYMWSRPLAGSYALCRLLESERFRQERLVEDDTAAELLEEMAS